MRTRTVKALVAVGVLTAGSLSAGAYYTRRTDAAPTVTTDRATRGDILSAVSSSGTLEAVTTVEVGTQVSGAILSLHADFNSIVRRGQLLARLDPSTYQSAVDQARANMIRAEADQERLQMMVTDAKRTLDRTRALWARQLIPANELDTAEVAVRSAEAQVRSAAAQTKQAGAALRQAEVNLAKTIITAPIDGIVIARNVDVGQTVASSLQAPTLFLLAADLAQMRVKANIDESDVGRVREGQPVRFTVDAYPAEQFTGVVEQVRLNPVVEQNVVTYAAIVAAGNPQLKLKPGMTATLTIEIDRKDDVLRVPNLALRVRPSAEALAALGSAATAAAKSTPGSATVWVADENGVRPVTVRTGAADVTFTEVIGEGLVEGDVVITRITMPSSASQAGSSATSNPLVPSRPAGPPPR